MSEQPPSGYETILYEVDDRVATITLNRPERRNALNFEMRRDIVDALKRAESDGDVTLVLLKGAGTSFCAGYDLKIPDFMDARKEHTGWVGDPDLEEWTDQFARGCVRDWLTLWDLLKPVVVQVHGACLAGGLELMSMADIVFVADDARLGYPPMRGFSSPDTAVFAWKLTMAQAKYIQLTGNSITGAQAAEWGWVAKSFPAADLEHEVGRELHVLRNINPSILAANKMAVNQAYEVMGLRTHVQQSWVWHRLSNEARVASESSARRGSGDDTIRDSLSWMNRAADEVGLL